MKILRTVLEFFLPTACAYCGSSVGDSDVPFFCSTCWSDFSAMTGQCCPVCGRQFDSPEALTHSPDHRCLACRRNPPYFDQAVSIGYFEGPLREAIHQYKYRPCRSLGKHLANWMVANIQPIDDIYAVMPIPLHTSRLRYRGFNQALLLAHQISRTYNIKLCYDNLVRTRRTRPQVELSGEDRIKNVAGAFVLRNSSEVHRKKILLVDDVFTTGATMNECACVLKQAGAEQVTALTIARAV